MRFALGDGEYIGMRTAAERLRLEYARLMGASKPGTRRWYELVVGQVNAASAGACFRMPPMYAIASSLMPPYLSPANSGFSPFQIDWWTCMPEPLSPKIGFGMNVAVLPLRQATFLTMYLNFMTSSAALSSSSKR